MTETKETCDICEDPVDYCTCWRCMECEELFAEGESEPTLNDEGELFCDDCVADAYDRWKTVD
jgi:hypothetical protein